MQTYQDRLSPLTVVSHRLRGPASVPEARLQRLVHMAECLSAEYQTLAAAIPVSGRPLAGGLASETADES